MTVGTIEFHGKDLYVVVNPAGTLEKLGRPKWYIRLYLEIRQGIGKPLPIAELRDLFLVKCQRKD